MQKEMYKAFLDRDCNGKTLLQRIKLYQLNKIMKLKWVCVHPTCMKILYIISHSFIFGIFVIWGGIFVNRRNEHMKKILPHFNKKLCTQLTEIM